MPRATGTLLLLVLVAACQEPSPPAAEQTARHAILAAGDAFMAAYADPDSAITFFTSDARLIPPGGPAVSGHAALLRHLRAGNEAGTWQPTVTRDSIFVSGDLAVERGSYRMTLVESPDFQAAGHYVRRPEAYTRLAGGGQ